MRGSLQRRGKGSWRLVFDIEPGERGTRRQKVVTFRGKKRDAEKKLARLLAEVENGGFVESSNITVGEYLVQWLKSVETKTSAKTQERYEEIVRNALIPALGATKLSKLRPMEIQNFSSRR